MPSISSSHSHRFLRPLTAAIAAVAVLGAGAAVEATPASASQSQVPIFEAGGPLVTDPVDTLQKLRLLGVREIRLFVSWSRVAPSPRSRMIPRGFDATNPGAYPEDSFDVWDAVVQDAAAAGIGIDLDPGGRAPLWAMPSSAPVVAQGSLYPNATEYGQFVQALGKRYSGTYTPPGSSSPLPRVKFWSIWNEPNYISSLQPQGTGPNDTILTSPRVYRGLVGAAWGALRATGHGHDTIIMGELTPRGYPNLKVHPGIWPVTFVQSLYCLDSHYHQLQGTPATQQGCPTNRAGSSQFRARNPALFGVSGVSVHPYSRWYPPNTEVFETCTTGLCSSMGDINNLVNAVARAQSAYGSHRKIPIYSTEYGYQTSPPKLSFDRKNAAHNVSQSTAAIYINWAEYISYKNPQVASYDQYLLEDPAKPTASNDYGSYASGLEMWNGHMKPTYNAYRLPLYMPQTTASSSGQSLEVWGCVRPAYYAALDSGNTPQTVNIQFEPSGSSTFTTIDTVTITNPACYFDVHLPFAQSGTVRLQYTYPLGDIMLAPGYTVYSRDVSVTVR
jgi:hypothetical protein